MTAPVAPRSRRRFAIANLRAALWAWRALRASRRQLATGLVAVLPVPPRVSLASSRAVGAVLRRRGATCLERAFVQQRWLAAHGHDHEVVIGVTSPGQGFTAHAWLDGIEVDSGAYQEIVRLPAAPASPAAGRA